MARQSYILLPQDDFVAMTSLLHNVKIDIAKLEASYFVSEVSRRVEEIERILNDTEEDS